MKELFERGEDGRFSSSELLYTILDTIPVPLSWAYIAGGEIQFANRAFRKAFGYDADSFRTVEDWIEEVYLFEADRALARRLWGELWEAGGSGTAEINAIELRVLCADGSIVTVQHRGILLHDIGIGIATFEDISVRKKAEDALHRISYEDPLTQVGNRRALEARWREMTAVPGEAGGHRTIAVVLIDMDDFKPINDSFGHEVGDAALAAAAERLRRCIRDGDLLFRIGGDEFVILLPGFDRPGQIDEIDGRIERALGEPFEAEGREVALRATLGAGFWPQDGGDLRALLRQADQTLYLRKKRKKALGPKWAEPVLLQSPSAERSGPDGTMPLGFSASIE